MKILRAVKTNFFTQGFEENKNPAYKEWGMLGHGGYDWVEYQGNPIYWDMDIQGTVLKVEMDSNGGIGVVVLTQSQEGNFKHIFWHVLPNVPVKAGDILETGNVLAYADSTGKSTGSHLHRGMKEVELDSFGNWATKNHDNGYLGYIPIDKWFTNEFVLDYLNRLKKQISLLSQLVEALRTLIGLQKKLKNIYG